MTPRTSRPRTSRPRASRSRTILLAGGGTAGHVSPLLATARELQDRHPEDRILVLGTAEGLEADLVPAAGFELLTIAKVPFPRRPDGAALRFPLRFRGVIRAVRRLLREHEVDAVVGFGGYVCPPAYLAARAERTPVVLHEANQRPGLANRLGARSAAAVTVALPGTPLPGARVVGMPMRREISTLDRAARHHDAARALHFDPERPVLLVTGGSSGAQSLNAAFTGAAVELAEAGIQVLHITGRGKLTDPGVEGYRVVDYVRAMEDAYAAADLAVTRSGSGTVCELAAIGLPAILVPLPIGNGEQALNGRPLVDAGGALMVDDALLDPDWVRATVPGLVHDRETLAAMSRHGATLGVRDADVLLARIVDDVLGRPGAGSDAGAGSDPDAEPESDPQETVP